MFGGTCPENVCVLNFFGSPLGPQESLKKIQAKSKDKLFDFDFEIKVRSGGFVKIGHTL